MRGRPCCEPHAVVSLVSGVSRVGPGVLRDVEPMVEKEFLAVLSDVQNGRVTKKVKEMHDGVFANSFRRKRHRHVLGGRPQTDVFVPPNKEVDERSEEELSLLDKIDNFDHNFRSMMAMWTSVL